ncbi:MAG: hypothetical protein O2960_08975 [Verrucomicrobia bacterium]|nr:hypothetical protein [Verrucomicrobiota bacterium]
MIRIQCPAFEFMESPDLRRLDMNRGHEPDRGVYIASTFERHATNDIEAA